MLKPLKTSIIAIVNQKGGIGKTATSVNLAASFANSGKKTLLIDLDYQANATSNFGKVLIAKQDKKSLSSAIKDKKSLSQVVLETEDPNLDIVAGDMGLSRVSKEKALEAGAVFILKKWLDTDEARQYEVIIIDTHPSLDLLFQMALTAAHYYLIPMFPEADPFDGLAYVFSEVKDIKDNSLNPQLFLLGVVITRFDSKNSTHNKFLSLIEEFTLENKIKIAGLIPNSAAIASSSSLKKPLLWHSPKLNVTKAYMKLAKELLPELRGAREGRAQGVPSQYIETPKEIMDLFSQEEGVLEA